ncbi:FAD-dependent oxidoreductase [Hyphomicrobium sp.]|uniref:NAD(P)/FAD-dependent oxidoreductase n=1 Tax=Hyphomicrobium sp. TaxID=82 RepID=UPI002D7673D8|nr:FAD-dependent oxidoreductase [Hyphomicrobium sp.]HET6389240.1 FAD-dependent oxidoreductase [Hyphomicrobium sp.]
MVEGYQAKSAWADPTFAPLASDALKSSEHVDLAIVGGGILGLSSALHAARRGLSVRVLDAAQIGDRASGLNGGQVIPGLKYDPDWLLQHFGQKRGEALVRFASSVADDVFDLIVREKLDVPHQRNGWIQAAHSEAAVRTAEQRAKQWIARGVPAKVLSTAEVTRLTGARGYLGGWLDPRAGAIQPLAYTRELARIAIEAGACIAQNTRVTSIRRTNGAWIVNAVDGRSMSARGVIVATNAYADDLIPGLARTLLPLHSFQIATAPLSKDLLSQILPEDQVVSDSRRILVYFRKGPDGRMLLGGRGSMAEPVSSDAWAHLEHALKRLYPALEGVTIEKRWFGRVALTLDHLPHVHEPEPGLLVAAGCQGRGVGLMTALGPRLVDYFVSKDPDLIPFPLTPIRPIPFHAFRNIGIGAAIAWYRLIDMLER